MSIAASGFLLIASAFGQKKTFVPANDVSLTVVAEESRYKAGVQINLKYEIVNISNAALYVPREWTAQCPRSPHMWAWFESSTGEHFIPGYATGNCSRDPKTLSERMQKEAVLLKPGQKLEGTLKLDSSLFGLTPGEYRLECTLTGWRENEFTAPQYSELAKMGAPFMRGEVPASTRLMLIP